MDTLLLLLWTGSACAVAAILLLRVAWARPRRSIPLNAAAWAVLVMGVSAGAADAGAWGMAIVSVVAIGSALVCLAYAAAISPAGKAVASNRRANMLPSRGERLRLGGRLLTFFLTVPAGLITSLALGLAVRALGGFVDAHEADSNVLLLFLVPLVWAILATLLLMWPRRRTQMLFLAAPTLAGALILTATGIGA